MTLKKVQLQANAKCAGDGTWEPPSVSTSRLGIDPLAS